MYMDGLEQGNQGKPFRTRAKTSEENKRNNESYEYMHTVSGLSFYYKHTTVYIMIPYIQ